MKRRLREPETALEIGIGLFGVAILAAGATLLFGRVSGGVSHQRRKAEGPPPRNSVPNERHQNISSAAAR